MNKRLIILIVAIFPTLIASMACGDGDLDSPPARRAPTQEVAATQSPTATSSSATISKSAAITTSDSSASSAAKAETVTESAPKTVAIATATTAPQPTATSVPTATPAPTAAPVVDNGPWMTGLEAMEIASATQSGIISYIDGHAASAAGQADTSDNPSDIASPGGGYGTSWSVAFLQESGSTNFCSVRGQELDCFESEYTPAPGEVSSITIDSDEIFSAYEKIEEWNMIIAKGNVSLLLVLEPGSGELNPDHTYWTAIATAQGTTSGIGGGSFYFDLNTDTVTYTTWSY